MSLFERLLHPSQPTATRFSGATNDQLLDSFRSSNWNQLASDDRIAVVQELENRAAVLQGREPARVVPMNDFRYYGSYDDSTNQMKVNVDQNVSPYEVLDTFVHENNHAYQAECIKNDTGYDEFTRHMMAAESARDQNGNLYNYYGSSPAYDRQLNEMDSNNAAARFLIGQSERYGDDPAYREYLEDRIEHFEQVNSDLDANPEAVKQQQMDQLDRAHAMGDLSDEQYESAMDHVENDHLNRPDYDSHQIEEELRGLEERLEAEPVEDQVPAEEQTPVEDAEPVEDQATVEDVEPAETDEPVEDQTPAEDTMPEEQPNDLIEDETVDLQDSEEIEKVESEEQPTDLIEGETVDLHDSEEVNQGESEEQPTDLTEGETVDLHDSETAEQGEVEEQPTDLTEGEAADLRDYEEPDHSEEQVSDLTGGEPATEPEPAEDYEEDQAYSY